jgi:acetyl-CoA acetyltransferase
MGDAAQDPADFPTSPALAAPKALQAAGLEQSSVDYWEVNEAFAVVDLVNRRLLDLDPDRQGHEGIASHVVSLLIVPLQSTRQSSHLCRHPV